MPSAAHLQCLVVRMVLRLHTQTPLTSAPSLHPSCTTLPPSCAGQYDDKKCDPFTCDPVDAAGKPQRRKGEEEVCVVDECPPGSQLLFPDVSGARARPRCWYGRVAAEGKEEVCVVEECPPGSQLLVPGAPFAPPTLLPAPVQVATCLTCLADGQCMPLTPPTPAGKFVCEKKCDCPADGSACIYGLACIPGSVHCLNGLVPFQHQDGTVE